MSGSTEAQTTEGNPNQPNEAMPVSFLIRKIMRLTYIYIYVRY